MFRGKKVLAMYVFGGGGSVLSKHLKDKFKFREYYEELNWD